MKSSHHLFQQIDRGVVRRLFSSQLIVTLFILLDSKFDPFSHHNLFPGKSTTISKTSSPFNSHSTSAGPKIDHVPEATYWLPFSIILCQQRKPAEHINAEAKSNTQKLNLQCYPKFRILHQFQKPEHTVLCP